MDPNVNWLALLVVACLASIVAIVVTSRRRAQRERPLREAGRGLFNAAVEYSQAVETALEIAGAENGEATARAYCADTLPTRAQALATAADSYLATSNELRNWLAGIQEAFWQYTELVKIAHAQLTRTNLDRVATEGRKLRETVDHALDSLNGLSPFSSEQFGLWLHVSVATSVEKDLGISTIRKHARAEPWNGNIPSFVRAKVEDYVRAEQVRLLARLYAPKPPSIRSVG